MSCNGCRVLRKGCSESCILRPCLQWIHSPESQGHATVFVAKFFGRAGLMSFISSVPEHQRPAIFQSLLFEACGRTVNPVNGAVGLLWTGNWHVCQSAVDTILRGGTLQPLTDLPVSAPDFDDASAAEIRNPYNFKRDNDRFQTSRSLACDLDLSLMSGLHAENSPPPKKKRRPSSPSEGSSSVTSSEECDQISSHQKLLTLFL